MSPIRLRLCWLFVSALLLGAGCGVEVGNPKNPTGDGGTPTKNVKPTSVLALDNDAALQVIADQMDETAATANEQESSTQSSSLLLSAALSADDASCEVGDDGKVTVTASSTGEFVREKVRRLGRRLTITNVFSSTQTKSRTAVWSSESSALACNPLEKLLAVDFRDVKDLSLALEFSREETFSIKLKNALKPLRSGYFKAQGVRNLSWEKVDPTSKTVRTLRTTISSDVARDMILSTAANSNKTVSSQVTIKEGEPLSVLTDFSRQSGAWETRTIESGTVLATQKDGSVLESTYDNVTFLADIGCQAQSGSIAGKLFDPSDLTRPYLTYSVLFTAVGATISLSNGKSMPYQPYTCDADAQ
jgi:hypothetical protein